MNAPTNTPLGGGAAEIACDWADNFINDWAEDDEKEAGRAEADMERFRPFLVAAATAFEEGAVRRMRTHLALVRSALETARDALGVAGETHPDEGEDCDDQCDHAPGGIAGACTAGAEEAVEAIYFLDQVLLALPPVEPDSAAEAKALAEARINAQPPVIAIVLDRYGGLERVATNKGPIRVLIAERAIPHDHPVDQIIRLPLDGDGEPMPAIILEDGAEDDPIFVHRLSEAQRMVADLQSLEGER